MKKILPLVCLMVMLAGEAWGATYYLHESGTAANVAAATGDCSNAAACMSAATHNADNGGTLASGDVVVVCNEATVTVNLTSEAAGITYRKETGESRPTINPSTGNDGFTITHASTTLSGLEIRGDNVTYSAVRLGGADADNVTVDDCKLWFEGVTTGDLHCGIHANNAGQSNLSVIDTEIYNIPSDGIAFQGSSLTVINPNIHHVNLGNSSGDCIHLYGDVTGATIQGTSPASKGILDHSGSTVKQAIMIQSGGAGIVIQDLEITGGTAASYATNGILVNANGTTIRRCSFQYCGTAITGNATGVAIDNCRFLYGNYGYYVGAGDYTGSIFNSVFDYLGTENIHLGATNGNVTTLKNNISRIRSVGDIHILKGAASGITSDYNLFYPAQTGAWSFNGTAYDTIATWRTASSQDANSVNADPLITSTGALSSSLSPAVNAGTRADTVGLNGSQTDGFGASRWFSISDILNIGADQAYSEADRPANAGTGFTGGSMSGGM